MGPRPQTEKSSTLYEHQQHWRSPHPGQCKHTHSVRVISRYPLVLANTQTEPNPSPANKMSPTAVPPTSVSLKDKRESLVQVSYSLIV